MAYLPYVHGLDLRKTELHEEFPPLLSEMTNLRWLRLNGNGLDEVNSDLFNLVQLKRLDVAYNRLSTVPSEITALDKLDSIGLHHNEIGDGSLPIDLFNLSLKKINLSWNKLTAVPAALLAGRRTHLVFLSLAHNEITDVSATVVECLPCLRTLDLSHNLLIGAPLDLHKLHRLETLNIGYNRLKFVDWVICSMKTLRTLDVSGNPLTVEGVPEEIAQLTTLTELSINEAQLEDIPQPLFKLTQLERLSLSNNSLYYLSGDIMALRHVRALNLSNNAFRVFPPLLCRVPSLQRLDLNFNGLQPMTVSPTLMALSALQVLSLAGNGWHVAPTAVFLVTSLTKLDLSHNHLKTLPIEIYLLTKLTKLDLNNNDPEFVMPRTAPPEERISMATREERALLRLLTTKQKELTAQAVKGTLKTAERRKRTRADSMAAKPKAGSKLEGLAERFISGILKLHGQRQSADYDDGAPSPAPSGAAIPAPLPPGAIGPGKRTWLSRLEEQRKQQPQVDIPAIFGEIELREQGLYVWKMERTTPVPLNPTDYGIFDPAGVYIVLYINPASNAPLDASSSMPKAPGLPNAVHFWVGARSKSTEATAAAIHAILLIGFARVRGSSRREEQGEESAEFHARFSPLLIQVLQPAGDVTPSRRRAHRMSMSGVLVKVDDEEDTGQTMDLEARLYRLNIAKNGAIKSEMLACSLKNLAPDQVYLLDVGKTYYLYVGEKATRVQRAKGRLFMEQLAKEEMRRVRRAIALVEVDMSQAMEEAQALKAYAVETGEEGAEAEDVRAYLTAPPKLNEVMHIVRETEALAIAEEDEEEEEEAAPAGESAAAAVEGAEARSEGDDASGVQKTQVKKKKIRDFTKWVPNVYEVDVGRNLQLPQCDGPLSRSMLRTDGAYIVDCGSEVFVWLGRKTGPLQKKTALAFVTKLMEIFNRPDWVSASHVLEGNESVLFRSKFPDWETGPAGKTDYAKQWADAHRVLTDAAAPTREFEVAALYTPPLMAMHMSRSTTNLLTVKDSATAAIVKGKHFILQKCVFNGRQFVRTDDPVNVFYADQSYVFICPASPPPEGERFEGDDEEATCAIFFWQGRAASPKAWLSYQLEFSHLVADLMKNKYHQDTQLRRITQLKEPLDFMALIDSQMVIYAHTRPSVEDAAEDEAARAARDAPMLFQVRHHALAGTKAVEVACVPTSVNPFDTFIACDPTRVAVVHEGLLMASNCAEAVDEIVFAIKEHNDVGELPVTTVSSKLPDPDDELAFWELLGASGAPSEWADDTTTCELRAALVGSGGSPDRVSSTVTPADSPAPTRGRSITFQLSSNALVPGDAGVHKRRLREGGRLFRAVMNDDIFTITHVTDHTQGDLDDQDAVLLDTGTDVLVWYGRMAAKRKQELTLCAAHGYLQGDGREEKGYKVVEMHSGAEAWSFTARFHGWKSDLFSFVDPRAGREAQLREEARLEALRLRQEAAAAGTTSL